MNTTEIHTHEDEFVRPSRWAITTAIGLIVAMATVGVYAATSIDTTPAAEHAASAISSPMLPAGPGAAPDNDGGTKGGIDAGLTTTTTVGVSSTTQTAAPSSTSTPPASINPTTSTTAKATTSTVKDTTSTTVKDTTTSTTVKDTTTSTTAKETTTTTENPGEKIDTPLFNKMEVSYNETDGGKVTFWWKHPDKTNSHVVPDDSGIDGVWIHLPGEKREEAPLDDESYRAKNLAPGKHRLGVQYFTETDGYADSDILWIDVEITFDQQ